MIEKITRDAAVVEPLREAHGGRRGLVRGRADVLPRAARRRGAGRAAIAHALAFDTWRSLVRRQGLAPGEAVDLMAPPPPPPAWASGAGSEARCWAGSERRETAFAA